MKVLFQLQLATKALKEVLPELEGKLHGLALRVPTKNVSLVDLVVDLKEDVTNLNKSMTHSEIFGLDGILDVEDEPLVSMDFNTNLIQSSY